MVQKSYHGEHNELHKVHKEIKTNSSLNVICIINKTVLKLPVRETGTGATENSERSLYARLLRQVNFVPLNDFGPRNDVSPSTQNLRDKD